MKPERLNKLIARAGLASRRSADRLIEQGRVTVNGAVVTELGLRVDPGHDAIKVDGKRLPAAPATHSYYLLHKPRGVLTTLSDPEGRPTIRDLLPSVKPRLYPVGRLDFNSEGLLLLTDDGDLARRLMHPGSGVAKTYLVKVSGSPPEKGLARLRQGVELDGRRTQPARVRITRPGHNCWLEVTICEGRKHQVRRMLEAIGHPVVKLRRVGYGGLELGSLPPGTCRALTADEVRRLRRSARRHTGRADADEGPAYRRN